MDVCCTYAWRNNRKDWGKERLCESLKLETRVGAGGFDGVS